MTGSLAQPAAKAAKKRFLRFGGRETGVALALLVMCIALTLLNDRFLTTNNLLNIGRQVSLLGIMAVGMTFVLASGEVDLSVGSIYAFCGLVTGMVIVAGYGLFAALVLGILAGIVIGIINGLLSTYGRLPSLIATLGMLSMVRGAALILTDGRPVTVNAKNGAAPDVLAQFTFLGQGSAAGIPMQLVFFALIALAGWFLLARTSFGFRVLAVGGSTKAARVSGISVERVKIAAFALMGGLAAFAGILSIAFLPSGQAGRTGLGLELDVIAATIVGGTSLAGGEGTIIGTILGVLIIGVLRNGLVLTGVSPFAQEFLIGLVIVVAVAIDKWTIRERRI
ncbi:ABC transporter permease [Rhodobacter sp. 24-YEA-8]|uniref:ABC transporter permease n=1 Tax=Rhodobacter sp. 24-YEA-8 TaxID=1884310 RepID=UPI000896AF10|nr:ABC transporter permease [Rhodobacter sp. 24-YEA-8]SED71283.1 monosaccharide ABC transporter membrane protein, CUT2 family [Rhodobacter sp. 24-YEA-8]